MRALVFTQFNKINNRDESESLRSRKNALHSALAATDSISVPTLTSHQEIPDKVTIPSAEQMARLGPIVQQSAANKLK